MKRILLPLSLLLLLALAAGCSAQGEAQLDPTMAQQLQIDETMAATLAPGIQDVDVTDRGTTSPSTSARPWATTGSSTSSTT